MGLRLEPVSRSGALDAVVGFALLISGATWMGLAIGGVEVWFTAVATTLPGRLSAVALGIATLFAAVRLGRLRAAA